MKYHHVIYTEKGMDIVPIEISSYSYVLPKWYQTSTTIYVGVLILQIIIFGAIVLL